MAIWPEQIRRCREERRLTQEEFARELARVAWEQSDERVGVDAAMVSKWERGTKAPSRRYQRWLTQLVSPPKLDESGDELAGLGLSYARHMPDALDSIDQLGQADMKRRTFLKSAFFLVGASAAPSRDWLVDTIERGAFARGRIDAGQVDAIRRTFGVFQEMDVMRGGGHARHQLAQYVTGVVTPLLRENDPGSEVGRALFDAAAEQLYLLGWMAYDDGQHALAQRYLIQALRLAQEAQSPASGAHVLAGLSDQATLTGHPDQALQLARAGRAGLGSTGQSFACLADLWALQARAEAALGDSTAAQRSIVESQRAAGRIDHDDEAEWAKFIDPAYLNGEYANAFRDIEQTDQMEAFATTSAEEAARQHRARRGSLAHATLARTALARHDLAAAAASASTTVHLAVTVRSARSVEAVTDLRQRLAPHVDSPAVADFLDLADALLPTAS